MIENLPPDTTSISIIVPAAGCGARAGLGRNKVLCAIHGRPLLWWTLRALSHPDAFPVTVALTEIIVAAREDEWREIADVFAQLVEQSTLDKSISLRCIEGGATRQQSVHNAARAARGDWLLVHDAARPLIAPEITRRVIQTAQISGAAIAAMPVSDTVKLAAPVENVPSRAQSTLGPPIEATLDRRRVWLAQTPQVFRRDILLQAFEQAERDHFEGTDCASLVERLCDKNGDSRFEVTLVEGSAQNFKVTYADDLERAAQLLEIEAL